MSHTHPCLYAPHGCTNTVTCSGTLARNYDGWPEVICDMYHNANGTVDAMPCDTCVDAMCVSCEAVLRFEPHLTTCSEHPDNLEPPDPWDEVAWPFDRMN